MGTVTIPETLPSPTNDARDLRKAFQGWGTDEKAIIRILGHRNWIQRQQIRETYEQVYKESLIQSLRSELSGDFLRAVVQWTEDPAERDAKLAKEALKSKVPKNLVILAEIACASSPHHLFSVRRAYCSLFNCSLEEDIILHVPPPLRKLLVNLVSSYRFDGEVVDEEVAGAEAAQLREAVEKKQFEEDHFIWILSTRNKSQLKSTFNCYIQQRGKPIEQDIKESISAELSSLLRAAIWCIDSPERHFAEVIWSSIHGLGTDENSLTRAVIARAEIDMAKIKEEYSKTYKVSLVDDIVGDTSGDYMDMLLTVLGEGKL